MIDDKMIEKAIDMVTEMERRLDKLQFIEMSASQMEKFEVIYDELAQLTREVEQEATIK